MKEFQQCAVYKHYKGGFYYVLGLAEHTETAELMVVYHALDDDSETYARPMEMFLEEVPEGEENPTGQEQRFKLVEFIIN